MTTELKTFRFDSEILQKFRDISVRRGDLSWHVNEAMRQYKLINKKEVKPRKPKFDPIEYGSKFDRLHQGAWAAWCEKRKEMKKPVSESAAKSQIEMLVENDQESQRKIIWQSIQNDYQGLFKLKEDKTNGQPRKSLSERSAAKTTKLLANCEDVGNLLGSDDPFIRPQVGFKGGGVSD